MPYNCSHVGLWLSRTMVAAALVVVPALLTAQALSPKPGLGGVTAAGCAAFPTPVVNTQPPPAGAEDEARRLVALGQDAALQGEHEAARDAFSKAAELTPANPRVAYYLGREYEALGQASTAVREYCRYLALAPTASDGDEVRGRVVRLVPQTELDRLEEARTTFRSGVALLERGQYLAADSAFTNVAAVVPQAPEPIFNRGLARAARGMRAQALEDFQRYLELAPNADDRAAVRAAMARLPDRVYSPGSSFLSGLLFPGFGQMSTGRPLVGALLLGAAGGAVAFGMRPTETTDVQRFDDPFGNPYTDSVVVNKRPNLIAGVAAAAVLWIGGAWEASAYAARTRSRARTVIRTAEGRREITQPRLGLAISPTSVGVRVEF